ncbi:bursicon [Anopheles maculipalpis]|uniref:bursicon n=1 Tax=Anopheles maculipalpis TaxID=1496333 RepID=UPI0021593F70|nr:bursicon [Anopheles maculipalpis]
MSLLHTYPLSHLAHLWSEDGGSRYSADDCQVTPVIHVLQYPGCVPKPIPSFACIGRCASYIQVSGSKIWQMERSCMCCQESGEREASVSLFCPKAKNGEKKFRKVGVSGRWTMMMMMILRSSVTLLLVMHVLWSTRFRTIRYFAILLATSFAKPKILI